jgi:hypothetical protein
MPASSKQKMPLAAQIFLGGHIQELKNYDQHVIREQSSEDARSLASMKNAQSDLLRLPGEVRNHIYDYCLSSSHMRLAPKGLPTYMIGTQTTRAIQGNSCSLAQVCRRIRQEFKPMYWTKVSIKLVFLKIFMETFMFEMLHEQMSLAIELRRVPLSKGTNLLPLMQLRDSSTNLAFHFINNALSTENSRYLSSVNAFFAPAEGRWRRFLEEEVTAIEFCEGINYVFIRVKPKYKEAWMERKSEFDIDRIWRARVGLLIIEENYPRVVVAVAGTNTVKTRQTKRSVPRVGMHLSPLPRSQREEIIARDHTTTRQPQRTYLDV